MYTGLLWCKTLKVIKASLYRARCLTGSQWSWISAGVMCSNLPARRTTRANVFYCPDRWWWYFEINGYFVALSSYTEWFINLTTKLYRKFKFDGNLFCVVGTDHMWYWEQRDDSVISHKLLGDCREVYRPRRQAAHRTDAVVWSSSHRHRHLMQLIQRQQ